MYKLFNRLMGSDSFTTLITPYSLLILLSLYLLFLMFFIINPSIYFNMPVLHFYFFLIVTVIFLTWGAILAYPHVKKYRCAAVAMPYIMAHLFALPLMFISFGIGLLSFPSGELLVAAPMFGFLLYNARVIFITLFSTLLCALLLFILSLNHVIAYAPVWTNAIYNNVPGQTFYFSCMVLFSIPHLLIALFSVDMLTDKWRNNEETIVSLSLTDPLLNMNNRRAILNILDAEFIRCKAQQLPLSLLLLDIDYFKQINDAYGHPTGDQVLIAIGQSVQSSIRDLDSVGRYGGEEFLFVLPNTTAEEAKLIADRCRLSLSQLVISPVNLPSKIAVTGSFGLSSLKLSDLSTEDMIHRVDHELYRAKAKGRNCICWEGQTEEYAQFATGVFPGVK